MKNNARRVKKLHLKDTRHNRAAAKLQTNRASGEKTAVTRTEPEVNSWTRAAGFNANWRSLGNNASTADRTTETKVALRKFAAAGFLPDMLRRSNDLIFPETKLHQSTGSVFKPEAENKAAVLPSPSFCLSSCRRLSVGCSKLQKTAVVVRLNSAYT